MVVRRRSDGRLAVRPIGHWNARFAGGARVRVHGYDGNMAASGTLLPEKASGHVFNEAVDHQPSDWAHIALRLDLVDTSPVVLAAMTRRLFSGAGHDGLAMHDLTDIGMLFLRCREGLSHHPDEAITAEDAEAGTRVLMALLTNMSTQRQARKSA